MSGECPGSRKSSLTAQYFREYSVEALTGWIFASFEARRALISRRRAMRGASCRRISRKVFRCCFTIASPTIECENDAILGTDEKLRSSQILFRENVPRVGSSRVFRLHAIPERYGLTLSVELAQNWRSPR